MPQGDFDHVEAAKDAEAAAGGAPADFSIPDTPEGKQAKLGEQAFWVMTSICTEHLEEHCD
jgi:hypothetical protein